MESNEALEQIKYLKEITARTRLIAAYGYPFFILWGIIVATGYLGSFIFSTHLAWLVIVIGAIISLILRRIGYSQGSGNRLLKKIGLQCMILVIATALMFEYLLRYQDGSILNAFPSFQFGVIYLVASVHMGRDLAIVGLWMVFTAIISLAMPSPVQDIWLAVTVGGGLTFTGFLFKYQLKKSGLKIEN